MCYYELYERRFKDTHENDTWSTCIRIVGIGSLTLILSKRNLCCLLCCPIFTPVNSCFLLQTPS